MYKICAVVVTHNRKTLLLRNIKSLLLQSYPLDILIFDNASTDDTEQFLRENNIIDKNNVFYVKSKFNTGGAGGFKFGAMEAYEKGYDYMWLMDDDGYCLNNSTLQELISNVHLGDKVILNSYVTFNSISLEPTFSIDGIPTRKELLKKSINMIIKGGSPYNGTLIPRSCFAEVGFNDERFFIYGDENDFYLRTIEHGYEWQTNMNSLYYHPINRTIKKSFNFLGFHVEIKNQPVWKYYLEVRNSEFNAIKHFGRSKYRLIGYLRVLIVSLLSSDKKFTRLKYGFLGLRDAKKEYFNRPLMFDK